MAYRCATCGEVHGDLPDVGFDKPDYSFDIPEFEREKRCKLTPDICEIDGEHFFVRGVIKIPVHDYPHEFGIGAWASLKKENFEIYLENFESDQIGPFFGWLCNNISHFPGPDQIKTMVHFQGKRQRPLILLEPTHDALAVAQRDGIPIEEAWKIVHTYMKPERDTPSTLIGRFFRKWRRP